MTRRYAERYGPYLAAGCVMLSLLVLGWTSVNDNHHQQQVDRELCEGTVANRDAIRAAFTNARLVSLDHTEDPEAVNNIFAAILQPIPPLECVDNKPVPKEE